MTPTQGEHAQPLRIEAAYSGDKLIGYTLATSGTEGTNRCLVFADQVGMPGIRLGDAFVPDRGTQITYYSVPLEAPAQPAAPQGGAYAPMQGLSAYLRAEAVGVQGVAAETLRQWASEVDAASHGQAPAATVIKKGADRQWMSERLGHLPDGIYSLYLAPTAQPAPAATKGDSHG